MKALVTGGAGFVGSHLVDGLLDRGFAVSVLDNLSTGRRENLAHVATDVEFFEGDIRDGDAVSRAVSGADIVYHEAALPSVPRSIDAPLTTNEVNVLGTLNVLTAARDAEVQRVVYASSSSVYGDSPGLPRREGQAVAPISPYAVSKLAAEHYCTSFARVYGMQTIALRYFNIFGPRQDPQSQYAAAIPRFITKMLAGEQPVVYGDGLQSRDFTFIENVVQCNMLAAAAPDEFADGALFNCATAQPQTIQAILAILNEAMGTEIEPSFEAARAGDVHASSADITLAHERLGYSPTVDIAEGLSRTIEHYRQLADDRDGRSLLESAAE
ncbi:MAG: SDR family oxidoreductase [Actinobacteria bacterium]|nr:SDR family oxidoreductase [Actinomycetota bacterium]